MEKIFHSNTLFWDMQRKWMFKIQSNEFTPKNLSLSQNFLHSPEGISTKNKYFVLLNFIDHQHYRSLDSRAR
ncbi:unnamed protein product [Hymenolepis diminuta]|uniref:Uncharacterized protein n=1 Tax=Hymenolepis diminuta TaxID=6216 RepID=A0A564YAD7_HYMDI|nr:unnamed protein product [Hymenolepis diminuta]